MFTGRNLYGFGYYCPVRVVLVTLGGTTKDLRLEKTMRQLRHFYSLLAIILQCYDVYVTRSTVLL